MTFKERIGWKEDSLVWYLVTRTAFNSGRVDIVTINDPFVDLDDMNHYDSTQGKFKDTAKAENGKLVSNGKPIHSFHERDLADIKRGDAGADHDVGPLVPSPPWRKLIHLKREAKIVPICRDGVPVCDRCEPWEVGQFPQDGQQHLYTTNSLAT
ncbi:Glyceraldehyde-3-phosphate dehydrogenase [Galemys pyrenaicus]|uniref:Glyceraldehyde-3-phosphate dehydrogenase n=1 Tax=Galemys pyrenaicus TaxID=202257 RepID=A0A8J6DWL6_GALPY|nr:Glyceraldehyde-3-phosphate dehydrogenase [Galemys pyrenaicus]